MIILEQHLVVMEVIQIEIDKKYNIANNMLAIFY